MGKATGGGGGGGGRRRRRRAAQPVGQRQGLRGRVRGAFGGAVRGFRGR